MRKQYWIIAGGISAVFMVAVAWPRGEEPPRRTIRESTPGFKQLYAEARKAERDGEWLKAEKLYERIVSDYSDADKIGTVQRELEDLRMKIILSPMEVPGKTVIHEVVAGDTLGKIARKYKTTVDLIKKSNGLKSDVIRVGQKLRIWTGTFNIFVDKSQNILLLRDGNDVVKTYRVATGKDNATPVGTFTIVVKLVDPVWYKTGVIIPPESPDNALGSRWLGFDKKNYGIHGTIDDDSIGRYATAGCVRMLNKDVEELFSLVPRRTKVTIVN